MKQIKPYKRYFSEDLPIPRSTLLMRAWRAKRKQLAVQRARAGLRNVIAATDLEREPESSDASENIASNVLEGLTCNAVNQDDSVPDHNVVETEPHLVEPNSDTRPNKGTEDCSNNGHEPKDSPPPLCSHTDCTEDDILAMALSVWFRHNLPYVALEDILKMFNTIYGEKKVSASKYSFLKKLSLLDTGIDNKYHYYCAGCHFYVDESDKGVCQICKQDLSELESPSYFASISLENQLKKLLQDEAVADDLLNHRFSREVSEDSLGDIYDGSEYRKLSGDGGVLSVPQNFSYSFFVDGVPVGKTKKSLWPIFVSINELRPEIRRKHILMVGLYYGATDPNQTVFLKPFVDEANKLSSEGFKWSLRGAEINSKVLPLIAVADSVARCQLLNMQTFTALYGCTFCYQTTAETDKRLKYVLPEEPAELRTLDSYLLDLAEVRSRQNYKVDSKRQYRGVKGSSTLSALLYFDIMKGFVVDTMHSILCGVVKTYFELVFENSKKNFWVFLEENPRYSIEDVYKVIDSRLKLIQPPSSIPRAPRDMKDHGSWKANEWRSWLLYYSIPCLDGLLKPKYLKHLAMLCKGYYLIVQQSVSQADIAEAHHLFTSFMSYYQKYFGEEYMYYNIHLLSHICTGVSRWGPAWAHDAFMYEANNRHLLQLCKNPFRVLEEVTRKYLIRMDIPRVVSHFATCDRSYMFCHKLLDKNLVHFKRLSNCILLGAGSRICALPNEEKEFLSERGVDISKCTFYNKILLGGVRISTSNFSNGKRHNDSAVYLKSGQSCAVTSVIVECNRVLLLVQYLIPSDSVVLDSKKVNISHIVKLKRYGTLDLIEPTDVNCQCILIGVGNAMYYSKISISLLLGD